MGTKNEPGEFDCYANAEPDEPMFILLARDRYAPSLVYLWSVMRELDGEDEAVVRDARDTALDMIEYAHTNGRQAHGLSTATFAGLMELTRAANSAALNAQNRETDIDAVRLFMCQTHWPETETGEAKS